MAATIDFAIHTRRGTRNRIIIKLVSNTNIHVRSFILKHYTGTRTHSAYLSYRKSCYSSNKKKRQKKETRSRRAQMYMHAYSYTINIKHEIVQMQYIRPNIFASAEESVSL